VSEGARDLLVRGIAAAKDGAKDEARFYLEWALRQNPSSEQCIKAWLWLSEISDDLAEKREYLGQVLLVDPPNAVARREMAILDGRLDPAEIVDPDNLPIAAFDASQTTEARRFACPHCGGRMVFTPDGSSLTCEYCAQRELSEALQGDGSVDEQDFVLALAKVKGHVHPTATRCLRCRDCGASFLLGPEKLSFTCPYCTSVYVIEQTEVRELVPPEGVIPFALMQEQARRAVLEWMVKEELDIPLQAGSASGVYLPMWTFDIDIARKGRRSVADDVLVSAGSTLSRIMTTAASGFSLHNLQPYDLGYLADWPAETYDISVADASIKARAKVRAQVAKQAGGRIEEFGPSVLRLSILSFKLILVPLWVLHYRYEGEQYTVVVNGQTGAVWGEKPLKGIRKWLSRLTADD
jgi:DNA-directed RNA polymerase subunit RPC12/RpoP